MPIPVLIAGDRRFPCRAVLFDKDGTLIDFHQMWGPITAYQVDAILRRVGQLDDAARRAEPAAAGRSPAAVATRDAVGASLEADLFAALGFSPATGRVDPRGPLAVGTQAQSRIAAATILYRHGIAWDAAVTIANDAFAEADAALPPDRNVVPCGDLPALFKQLRTAGLKIAVVTTDVESGTRRHLATLGIAGLVDALACADLVARSKPAPDLAFLACERLGIPPTDAVIVGDTVADLFMGQAAGLGGRIGVLSGVSSRDLLAPYADALIATVMDLVAHVEGR